MDQWVGFAFDDHVFFADTFGATRLRGACLDFKELYKQKHSDDQWMDEYATEFSYMGAPGIFLQVKIFTAMVFPLACLNLYLIWLPLQFQMEVKILCWN
ncbi:COP1-interacting protein 7-like [Henckelia pumila]|uniref:COP1-interacting protein 7-like n=1 Tax=Henckelia pumila TaxID=405737 RepID=UPI003C6DFDDF